MYLYIKTRPNRFIVSTANYTRHTIELAMKIEKAIGLPAKILLSAQTQYELEAAGADAQIADNKQETVTVTIPVRDRNLLQEIVKRFGWACVF